MARKLEEVGEKKIPWHLLPWDALGLVARVFEYGQRAGYGPAEWREPPLLSNEELFSASLRHLLASVDEKWGRRMDHSSGLPAAAHLAARSLMLLAYWIDDIEDDEPGEEVQFTAGEEISELLQGIEKEGQERIGSWPWALARMREGEYVRRASWYEGAHIGRDKDLRLLLFDPLKKEPASYHPHHSSIQAEDWEVLGEI